LARDKKHLFGGTVTSYSRCLHVHICIASSYVVFVRRADLEITQIRRGCVTSKIFHFRIDHLNFETSLILSYHFLIKKKGISIR